MPTSLSGYKTPPTFKVAYAKAVSCSRSVHLHTAPTMPRTSRRTAGFTESLIREMTRVAQQHGAINLSQGFPDFNPPREVIEAAKQQMDSDNHQYAVTWGAAPLRKALAQKLRRYT